MKSNTFLKKRSGMVVVALICCIVWGAEVPLIKLCYEMLDIYGTFEMLLFAGLRLLIAGLGVLLFAKIRLKKSISLSRKELPFAMLIAIIQTFAAFACFYIGVAGTTGVKSSILTATSVFFVAILAHFMFKNDKLSWVKTLGLVLGFSGVVLVNFNMIDEHVFSFRFSGEGLILLAVIMISVATVLIRKRGGNIDIVKLNGWQMFIGGGGLVVVGFIGSAELPAFTLAFWLVVLAYAVSSGVSFTMWFSLLKYHNASTVEQFKFAVPLSGSLLSTLVLPDEHITIYIAIAAILVSLGTYIGNYRRDAGDGKMINR